MLLPHRLASRATVSLRFGHAAALTVHRTVIHYRIAASLPLKGRLLLNLISRADFRADIESAPTCQQFDKLKTERRIQTVGKRLAFSSVCTSIFVSFACRWADEHCSSLRNVDFVCVGIPPVTLWCDIPPLGKGGLSDPSPT